MLERSDVEWPLWRKKVDGTFLKEFSTPIPQWVQKIWQIQDNFSEVRSKLDEMSNVRIQFKKQIFEGNVVKRKSQNGYRYRLSFQRELGRKLQDIYLMTFMRAIEAELTEGVSHRQIEKDISFWEFLDIEFDIDNKLFIFTPSFTVEPQFPQLFNRLIDSAPLKAVASTLLSGEFARIHKQDWKPRSEYKLEIGASNVIYMLLDTENKLLYVGEANLLIPRFNNGHLDIKNWDYYKYNVLPPELGKYRLAIERMLIRDLAAILDNKQGIKTISISDYSLANRKIDI
ncbi:hypothetical protein [Alteromonas mediterranea]|uniref:Uncharacterized protein n=1 Tax=Alteromonas mediterranea (strain DSM 17117 / CIP 110805 / LMG 28347 / Deep ecotype) TaxID=1774373 RepID=F2G213_ALTMD|nr:hypothetical protein [Alteromonas mediterranea]AEA96260.1 hypothetical protein MADE_1000555 [Alteromonas mediterranea DE]CAH1221048.1 hypothetical protein ISS312_02054 [Alteromonas mediterranea]